MRRSSGGWKPDDLERLYLGFGFEYREGSNHRIYYHPKHGRLRTTVCRHGELASGYVREALSLLDQLDSLENRTS